MCPTPKTPETLTSFLQHTSPPRPYIYPTLHRLPDPLWWLCRSRCAPLLLQILPLPPARARKHFCPTACTQMKSAVATWYSHTALRWFMAYRRLAALFSSSQLPSQ